MRNDRVHQRAHYKGFTVLMERNRRVGVLIDETLTKLVSVSRWNPSLLRPSPMASFEKYKLGQIRVG